MLVIIGGGLAGYALARETRKRDQVRPITLITADSGEVYAKPSLSSALRHGKSPDALVQKSAARIAAELNLIVRPHRRVTAIDRAARRLTLDDGATLDYAQLALAIGADPRPCPTPGAAAVPVASVNDLEDYRRWRADLAPGQTVLLIGAGLIGCEFADDLALAGHPVILVDPSPWPLARFFPQALGVALQTAMEGRGVRFHFGRSLTRIEPGLAVLDDGAEVRFDRALAAIGLVARTELAAAAGLTVDRGGIVVDRLLRTNDPNIYALGDCALTPAGPLPFVAPLLAEAKALATTLTGTPTPLTLPALPVVVKTGLAAVACPAPPGAVGTWSVTGAGADLTARFEGPDGALLGFALTGAAAAQQRALAPLAPVVLA